MARGKFVAYYRVSTDKQGRSGLGLKAQRKAVADYLGNNGWELIAEFQSSAEAVRTFCSRCGSSLEFQTTKTPDEIWIAAGTFDDDPGIRSTSHIYVASKAPWFEITDDLEQFPEEPE